MKADNLQYRIADGVLARTLGESLVLFHPETERLLSLKGTGVRIWSLLTEHPDCGEIIARLIDEFEGPPSVIEQQTLTFLARLETEQMIQRAASR